MVRDSLRFAQSGEWGFQRFVGDSKTDLAATPTPQQCFACHDRLKKDETGPQHLLAMSRTPKFKANSAKAHNLDGAKSIQRELTYGAKFRKAPIPNGANPEERGIPNVAKGAKGEKWRPQFAPFAQCGREQPFGIGALWNWRPLGFRAVSQFALFRLCAVQACRLFHRPDLTAWLSRG